MGPELVSVLVSLFLDDKCGGTSTDKLSYISPEESCAKQSLRQDVSHASSLSPMLDVIYAMASIVCLEWTVLSQRRSSVRMLEQKSGRHINKPAPVLPFLNRANAYNNAFPTVFQIPDLFWDQ